MSHLTELKQHFEEYATAELIASALEDISALRMQAIRSGFEKNRSFYRGIGELYKIVRTSEAAQRAGIAEQIRTNRQLVIALTSNKRFYGALMRDIVDALVRIMKEHEATFVVVGRIGFQYLEEASAPKKAEELVWENDEPSPSELETLLKLSENFDRVYVLYPKFINPFRQDVGLEDITQSPGNAIRLFEERSQVNVAGGGAAAAPEKRETSAGAAEPYFFEPEVPAILSFFNAQVKRVLLNGVLLEAELSRTAARLIRMEEAQEHAHELVSTTSARVRRETASLSNAALLETFAGFAKWKTL